MCVKNRKARAQCRSGCEGTSLGNLTKVLEPWRCDCYKVSVVRNCPLQLRSVGHNTF